jgi:hypothetical protein
VIVEAAQAAPAEHRRYREWKAGLPPEQRPVVELAEAAALAAVSLHERHKRVDAQLTASVVRNTMPDGITPRPTQRSHRLSGDPPEPALAQEAAWQAGQQGGQSQLLRRRIWQPPG